MYESFYGLRERPFTLLPDPDFLFLNDKHRTALDLLKTAVSGHSGFCVISGEIGAGKTTLIRELLNRLDESVCVGLVSNTHPSFGELLQWIMAAYGLPCCEGDKLELHKRFIDFAISQYAQNRHTLLIIDEAQNLTVEALEELRMLSNVNSENDLVLQVILVGQYQLRDKLQQPELEQFSQRIALNYHLDALDKADTCDYIRHRVSHAGGEPGLFSADACEAVYRLSGGIPRLINRICDLSLVYGCTAENRVISAELVNRVGEDQSMSALSDIPGVDRETAKPEQPAQQATSSATGARASEPSVASDSGELPAQANVSLEQAGQAGKTDSDTIVGALSQVLLPEQGAADADKEIPGGTKASRDLHQLVVNAEKTKSAKGERGALWLLLLVVVMAAGTGWLMRDLWIAEPIVASSGITEKAALPATAQSPATEKAVSKVPVTPAELKAAGSEADSRVTQDKQPLSVADSAEPVENDGETVTGTVDAAEQKAAEMKRAAQQRAAELNRKAEETARLKQESARRERERLAEQQRLEEQQRAAELNRQAEQTARLKQESARMEREQLAAEQRLEEQRAARKELERKARLESQKMAAAKQAAKKLAEQRSRSGARLPATSASGPAAYEEDDGEAVVLDAKASLSRDAATPAEEVGFTANPCHGPTARFLSTCRLR